MDKGTIVYFEFIPERPLVEEVVRAYSLLSNLGGLVPAAMPKGSVVQYSSDRELRYFSSIEAWVAELEVCCGVEFYLESVDRSRKYSLIAREIENRTIRLLRMDLSSELWMPYLDNLIGMIDGALEHSVDDYWLCKRLFSELDASRCLGSPLSNWCSLEDPDADWAFRFSQTGPQKLILPLEEKRAPRYVDGPTGLSDFSKDPVTGMDRWAWIVDKPFDEIAP